MKTWLLVAWFLFAHDDAGLGQYVFTQPFPEQALCQTAAEKLKTSRLSGPVRDKGLTFAYAEVRATCIQLYEPIRPKP